MSTDEQPPAVRIAYRTAANLRGERLRLQHRRDAIDGEDPQHPQDAKRSARLGERIERLDQEIADADARENGGLDQ